MELYRKFVQGKTFISNYNIAKVGYLITAAQPQLSSARKQDFQEGLGNYFYKTTQSRLCNYHFCFNFCYILNLLDIFPHLVTINRLGKTSI